MLGMLKTMRERFDGVPDPIKTRGTGLSDCLMSGLAVFSFKTQSPLRFDRNARGGGGPVMTGNLRSPFGVSRAPHSSLHPDTRMCGRLDEVDPRSLRAALLEDARGPAARQGIGEPDRARRSFPMAVDGTGYHSSRSVKCKDRRAGNRQDGMKTCHHRTLGAAIIHPDPKEVPLPGPEPVRRDAAAARNDCERNASKRPVGDPRRRHPHMKAIVAEDGLASNGPRAGTLTENGFRFMLGANPGTASFRSAGSSPATQERRGCGAT